MKKHFYTQQYTTFRVIVCKYKLLNKIDRFVKFNQNVLINVDKKNNGQFQVKLISPNNETGSNY